MPVDNLSLREECFFPTITCTDAGEVFLQGNSQSLIRLKGLEGIRRLPETTLEVTVDKLKKVHDDLKASEALRQRENPDAVATVPIVQGTLTVDGEIGDWKGARWLKIDERIVQIANWNNRSVRTQAAVAAADGKLYVVLRTDDPDLLVNSGDSPATMFKSGGGLDLMLGAADADPARTKPVAGDLRLLLSTVKGVPTAMLYRQVVKNPKGEPVDFTSPVKTVRMDEVRDVSSDLKFASATIKDAAGKIQEVVFEYSIPLAVLGLLPKPGLAIKGDVGVLRGDGTRTFQRAFWANKASGLVSDTPSEAELSPQLWGTFQFQ